MPIRDAHPNDFTQILRLNDESVHFLSPLTPARLELLHDEATYHRVLEVDGRIAAFLLAFGQGCTYDSPNYRWFAERFDDFLYVDRIVVSIAFRKRGIGQRFYEDLFAFARRQCIARVTCEFDIDPPNEASRRFHQAFGFTEVGTQWIRPDGKKVSLQAVSIQAGIGS